MSYCIPNRLIVTGSEDDLCDFTSRCCEDYGTTTWFTLCMDKVMPPPDDSPPGQDWIEANWGAEITEGTSFCKRSVGRLELRYLTLRGLPCTFYRVLGERFPLLDITAVAVDGYDYAYHFHAKGGIIDSWDEIPPCEALRQAFAAPGEKVPTQAEIDEMRAGAPARLAALARKPAG